MKGEQKKKDRDRMDLPSSFRGSKVMKKKRAAVDVVETCPSFRTSRHVASRRDVERLRATVSAPHVESFNYFLQVGLERAVFDIEPAELAIVDREKLRKEPETVVHWTETKSVEFWVENATIGKPTKPASSGRSTVLLPRECRERGLVYSAPLTATFCYKIVQRRNGVEFPGPTYRLHSKRFGDMPVMVMSTGCHLEGMSPKKLVQLKEEVRMYWIDCVLRMNMGRFGLSQVSFVLFLSIRSSAGISLSTASNGA